MRVLPHSATHTYAAPSKVSIVSLIRLRKKERKKKAKMKFERGHLMKSASERCSQFPIPSAAETPHLQTGKLLHSSQLNRQLCREAERRKAAVFWSGLEHALAVSGRTACSVRVKVGSDRCHCWRSVSLQSKLWFGPCVRGRMGGSTNCHTPVSPCSSQEQKPR